MIKLSHKAFEVESYKLNYNNQDIICKVQTYLVFFLCSFIYCNVCTSLPVELGTFLKRQISHLRAKDECLECSETPSKGDKGDFNPQIKKNANILLHVIQIVTIRRVAI